jgi:hypothetical protein
MLPLALILAAAPVMPEAVFPKPVNGPFELESVAWHPIESSKALALAAPLRAWRPELQLPATYQVLEGWSPNDSNRELMPVARISAGSCTEWVLKWNEAKMGSNDDGIVVVSTKADRVAVDALDVAQSTEVVQAAGSKTKTTIKPNGSITTEMTQYLIGDDVDVPEGAHSAFHLAVGEVRLKPDCTFEALPSVEKVLSGFVTDATSKERLFIIDDGKTTHVHYSSKPNTWAELTVEKVDRKTATLTVLFPKSKSRHPLKWNDARTELSCLNPDGTTQLFR